jgi:phospholipid/cholesterol/gamma-HCH transport system ATP-binding protein
MRDTQPILTLDAARPADLPATPREAAATLTVAPGDVLLIEARDHRRAALFADLCSGLLPLASGSARFLGHDWAKLSAETAAALRGRIGRVFTDGGWINFLDLETNILLRPLHHTQRSRDALRIDAAALAHRFGLPGLPLGRPVDLPRSDLRRAALVRAFLNNPTLLLLENPLLDQAELLAPLISAIEHARWRGAATIWFTHSDTIWHDRSLPITARLQLLDRGLVGRMAAA